MPDKACDGGMRSRLRQVLVRVKIVRHIPVELWSHGLGRDPGLELPEGERDRGRSLERRLIRDSASRTGRRSTGEQMRAVANAFTGRGDFGAVIARETVVAQYVAAGDASTLNMSIEPSKSGP